MEIVQDTRPSTFIMGELSVGTLCHILSTPSAGTPMPRHLQMMIPTALARPFGAGSPSEPAGQAKGLALFGEGGDIPDLRRAPRGMPRRDIQLFGLVDL